MGNNKKIGIASDHAGFDYRHDIKSMLQDMGYEVVDFGIKDKNPINNYKMIEDCAVAVAKKSVSRGIVICGTGLAVSIASNKVRGVRAALCNDLYTARKSREHNDSNVLAFGSRVVGSDVAKEIVKIWLDTKFEGGRHVERNKYIDHIEQKYL
jgi:ribose 5-phosphate isomerase B